ncbi:hypothetical protein AOQ84DRAFT_302229 [Glonium stellatum]|uniref:SAP domain-containing protein n=1 Tax=Glonium stellatum TaxID=574774 RepID=A0A8E2ES87_9PEZI|nr:hypothetical protein AOQ84DRAFT_302229 [Glonium stellatum]
MSTIHARSAIRRTTFNDSILFFAEDHGSTSSLPGPPVIGESSQLATGASKPKFASVGLNAEDTLIITLKQQGYKDAYISQELVKRGFRKLDHKTIATRTTRIIGTMAKYMDGQLADGLKEWNAHEDELLASAMNKAQNEISDEIEKLYATFFEGVAKNMRKEDAQVNFSAQACKNRWTALIDGTALIPTELDDDPERRRKENEARKEMGERQKLQKEEELKQAEKFDRLARLAEANAKLESASKQQKTANTRAKHLIEKAARAEQRTAKLLAKIKRAEENKLKKTQRAEQLKKKDPNATVAINTSNPLPVRPITQGVDEDTEDPRLVLDHEQLKKLCEDRSLSGEAKTKRELIIRLQTAGLAMSIEELKAKCRTQGLNTSGNKGVLRLQLAEVEASSFS